MVCFKIGLHELFQVIIHKDWNHTWGRNIREVAPVAANMEVDNFEVRLSRCVGSITRIFLYVTHTVKHNYISPSSTVGIQLHVSAIYVDHLQVVI